MSDELQSLIAGSNKGLAATQELQARYDAVGWQIQDPPYAKVRHMLLHLMKITADVAAMVEHVEHSVQNNVSSDTITDEFAAALQERADISGHLLFHAAQFANLGNYDLSEQLVRIYSQNARRFAPDSEFVDIDEVDPVMSHK
jgi:hypothetical protein